MEDLPASDPRSFMQQANVHCAYCDGAGITHQPPATVNLNYDQDPDYLLPPEKQVAENLSTMYKCMVIPNKLYLFFGCPYLAKAGAGGPIENQPHNLLKEIRNWEVEKNRECRKKGLRRI
ncbi:hypothetical protein L484_000709 [Morus notabilis]|uniref:Uncharacterized protein n=1 Tax=Morus notabilis TaxID=981085 RepID=W9RV59_9ROSA|nr:hypothetical protein L484_000709 [Morus notabilis]